MKHLGDITKLNGAEIPVVDCITGGSPCQDLSVAGKRAGLDGERSGLFMEQIRIVKEMRKKEMENGRTDESVRPRWMVWENVPGAFSSNGGKDFQVVLTEIVRIVSPECADVPMPKDGKWSKAGCLYDELGRWSIAWRVHDAQFWGVPQRRKRIALVADFGGLSAPEVLFERKGLSRDFEPCGEAGQETAGAVRDGIERTRVNILNPSDSQGNQIADSCGIYPTLRGSGGAGYQQGYTLQTREPILLESNQNHATVQTDGISTTLPASMGMGGGDVPMIVGCDVYNQEITGEVAASLTAASGGTNTSGPKVLRLNDLDVYSPMDAVCVGNGQLNQMSMAEQANTLDTMHDQQAVLTTVGTLCARDYKGVGFQKVIPQNGIVRRLTPLECERLQGYPDGWTEIGEWVDSTGKKHKEADSPRYKALGNSIALPFWFYLLRRISATYERPATLGSLFDGIGGFPLCWERCNGKGTAVWASEIEEFPIAVTKIRFPEEVQE